MAKSHVPFSILDLSFIREGGNATQALHESLTLAQRAEEWGYKRVWVAEHHNMPGIASAATPVVMSYLLGGTSTIRIGSGGVMLPNHAPLIVAEQFGTLESLYPGRVDLGLGRAPGTDGLTSRALRRHLGSNGDTFPQDVEELRSYFLPMSAERKVRAVPGAGLNIPIYILGSSDFGARLAARLGVPFAFASHFAPDYLLPALDIYRSEFQPSESLEKPYAMVGVNVMVADTDDEAQRLFTSPLQHFARLIRGNPGQLPPPVDSLDGLVSPEEMARAERMIRFSVVGDSDTVRSGIRRVLELTDADELIVAAAIFDQSAKLRSYELLSQIRE